MIRRLISAVKGRMAARGGSPGAMGTGKSIQAAEQEKAKQLLLAHARSVTAAHRRASRPGGPTR
ncbi:hypothetical protein OOJ91_06515 [Micromonospora lupini]|uniref:hypothetical protein n=1 Tax=Micromonospora lupini TaxID=285679 RepID=UPI002258D94B|nr:hypothetical protein [Micromonospora lupini]MCX5065531.1 hypothetical protein [Micromonospora lupini]